MLAVDAANTLWIWGGNFESELGTNLPAVPYSTNAANGDSWSSSCGATPCLTGGTLNWGGVTPIVSIACGQFTGFVDVVGSEVFTTGSNENGEAGGACFSPNCMFGQFDGSGSSPGLLPTPQANPLYPMPFEPNNMNASVNPGNAGGVNGGGTWSTAPANQTNGQWFEIDLGLGSGLSTNPLVYTGVRVVAANANHYPISYQVYVSTNHANWTAATSSWGSPVGSGVGASTVVTMTFPPQSAEYVRIVQTGTSTTNPWDIIAIDALD